MKSFTVDDQDDDLNNLDFEKELTVNVNRLDVVRKGENVRITTKEENKVLKRLREIFKGEEQIEIPSLKSIDKWLVLREVSLVNSLLPNVIFENVTVTTVNRLMYAGSYVV